MVPYHGLERSWIVPSANAGGYGHETILRKMRLLRLLRYLFWYPGMHRNATEICGDRRNRVSVLALSCFIAAPEAFDVPLSLRPSIPPSLR